jgi:ABC-type branched-subunit amino acid transport system permease subunit
VKSKIVLVGGGQSLFSVIAGAALIVVDRSATEIAEATAVKETIFV